MEGSSISGSKFDQRSCQVFIILIKLRKEENKYYFSRAGLFSKCPRMALRIMVFLPMRTTACSLNERRICCNCLDPTLSAPTMKHLGYSSRSCYCKRKCDRWSDGNENKHDTYDEFHKVAGFPRSLVLPAHLNCGLQGYPGIV